ncbi:acetyltransferase [Exiguobacterium sp. 17-1]|uniref:acetyltransferase n=1 Tax=Exiguobacterium sp. 17-1 TaxID=2931981 RepID=UPI001FFF8BA8|nr:acetyltransferase [Exiguobacterium sp. 17-1]MCK2156169.1 acetyltransferase [Exiguobacterium sp. 17-1]
MKNLILIGDSGHAKVIEHVAIRAGWKVIAKLDDKYSEKTFDVKGQIKGPTKIISDLIDDDTYILIAIGANRVRKFIFEKLNLPLENYATVIDPSAIISEDIVVGYGTCIMPNSVVNPASKIGNHVILNTRCVVEHDNVIEDYVHISPGSTLTGNVKVEEGCHIGAGATLIPSISVGSWTVVGAGSTVIRNVENDVTVVGSPSRVLTNVSGGRG